MSRRKLKSAAPNSVSVMNSRSPVAGDHLFFNKGSEPMNDAYAFSTSFEEDAFNLYNSLPRKSQRAIKRLMDFELSNTHGFLLRRKRFKEMYAFDWQTRRLLSMLLQTKYPVIKEEELPTIFENQSDVADTVSILEKNGYAISANKLTAKLPMDELQFQSKDKTSQSLSGKVLLDPQSSRAHTGCRIRMQSPRCLSSPVSPLTHISYRLSRATWVAHQSMCRAAYGSHSQDSRTSRHSLAMHSFFIRIRSL